MPGSASDSQRRLSALIALRYGLPLILVLIGFVLLFTVEGTLRWEGWAMCVGAGLSVLLLNWLFRLGAEGDKERQQEESARDFYSARGYWPDEEPPRPGQRDGEEPPAGAAL
jgi:hypothetical protein